MNEFQNPRRAHIAKSDFCIDLDNSRPSPDLQCKVFRPVYNSWQDRWIGHRRKAPPDHNRLISGGTAFQPPGSDTERHRNIFQKRKLQVQSTDRWSSCSRLCYTPHLELFRNRRLLLFPRFRFHKWARLVGMRCLEHR